LSNKFDSANYPSQVPAVLQKGDFWAWKKPNLSTDYPLASYSLKYKFYLIDGSTASNFTIDATESNNEYIISTSSTTSQTAGDYRWDAIIKRTSDNVELIIEDGYSTILDNAVRSHAKIVFDSICAVIENRASMDQSSMSIAGRSLSRMSIDELLTFKDRYKAEWLKEVKMARIKNNQGSGNTIKVNFGKIT
jgi:hypothetical protein